MAETAQSPIPEAIQCPNNPNRICTRLAQLAGIEATSADSVDMTDPWTDLSYGAGTSLRDTAKLAMLRTEHAARAMRQDCTTDDEICPVTTEIKRSRTRKPLAALARRVLGH